MDFPTEHSYTMDLPKKLHTYKYTRACVLENLQIYIQMYIRKLSNKKFFQNILREKII